MKNRLHYFLCILMIGLALGGCGKPSTADTSFGLADYLCAITPASCNGDIYRRVYLAPPDATYEITLNGKRLVVPMGFLDTTQLMSDPRYPEKKWLYLEMLLPDLVPHSMQNMREFFTPYERSLMRVSVEMFGENAPPWDEFIRRMAIFTPSRSMAHRPDQFGLAGWGEDFTKWPWQRPCVLDETYVPPCETPNIPRDMWRPINQKSPLSLMFCDPDRIKDIDARIVAMPEVERKTFLSSPANWSNHTRVMCDHYFFYEPLNSTVRLHYPRRFLERWKETEEDIRQLLDSFIVS